MKSLKLSHISAGFIAVLVGYSSSVAIIFQAAESLGASQAQLNSWMLALGVGMGATSILLSSLYRIPVITAWSTPGAALLVTSLAGVDMQQAIGSFIVCGLLIFICGLSGWFDKIQQLIPPSIASAMLAGILFQFGVGIFHSLQQEVFLVSVMGLSYLLGKPLLKNFNIPFVLVMGILICAQQGLFIEQSIDLSFAVPVWVVPSFSVSTIVSVAIPLFVVTMTSQNIPGAATIKAAGYQPPTSQALCVTGLCTMLLAPLGGFSYNLAAITAAICCSEEVDANKKTRYIAGICTGIFYIIIGLFGATVVSLFLIAPKALVVAIAGLALLNTLANSLNVALQKSTEREAALVTLLVTVSGINFFAIGAAFWGLLFGMLFLWLSRALSNKLSVASNKI
ncbi:MAG: benzoate/H(+) symporter BenE family transporter [Pseudomonadales bacterium]|nr:benzoate/H(+) symporter BenE family transporter [Pseudomonadales bacterium]NRA16290.1 benzoate/H(+) symporter BenE family transporter [Oceanospirillaceae bacterium]